MAGPPAARYPPNPDGMAALATLASLARALVSSQKRPESVAPTRKLGKKAICLFNVTGIRSRAREIWIAATISAALSAVQGARHFSGFQDTRCHQSVTGFLPGRST